MDQNKEPVLLEMQENELTEMISINVICRLCANQNDKLIGIYSEDGINNDLPNKMNLYLPIKVSETDDMPLQCCWQCASTVLAWHELVVTSVEADRRLRSYQFVTEKQLIHFHVDSDSLVEKSEEIHSTEEVDMKEDIGCHDNTSLKSEDADHKTPKLSDECVVGEKNIQYAQKQNIETTENLKYTPLSKIYQNAVNIKTITCKLCNESFSAEALKTHMNDVHNIKQAKFRRKKSEIDAIFSCTTCEKSFTRKFDMQKHILSKHPTQKHEILPSRRSINLEILKKCKVSRPEGVYYQCDMCEQRFQKTQSLVRHRNVHVSERLYCCHICGKKFLVSNALARHINRLHYGIRNFACDICNKKFTNKTTRDEHMNIHTNSRPFICDICGKSFKQNSSLHIHKMFHTNIFRFSCNICEKKFRRRYDLKVHNWIHTGVKPHSCTICNKSFRLEKDLKRHSKVHMDYFCDECGLKFEQERFLKAHKKIH